MAQCKLDNCGKEITSSITGEYCTSHYFALKRANDAKDKTAEPNKHEDTSHADKPIMVQSASQEKKETYLCPECNEEHPKPDRDEDRKCLTVNRPSIRKVTTAPNDGKKYCQSCIERYGNLVPASREWTPGYFICDDCLTPLLQSQLDYDSGRVEQARQGLKAQPISNSPMLNQVYELMEIPKELRFNDANQVLQNRNDIFNYHAPAIVNKTVEEISQQVEVLSILLFQIKIAIEPRQAYIDKVKYEERAKAGLSGLNKSEKEFTKRAKSGVKLSQDEKMAKTLGISVEKYREMASAARKTEFKKITGT